MIINSRMPEEEQRVVLAHEISHHFLHTGNQLDMEDSFRRLQEEQTHRLALYILIPTFMLNRMWSESPQYIEHEIAWLAESFKVTRACMTDRLYVLLRSQPFASL